DALEEHGLDRVLPRPQRQRVIAQRTEIRIEHQGRKSIRRHRAVQAEAPPTSPRNSNEVAPAAGTRCSGTPDSQFILSRDDIVKAGLRLMPCAQWHAAVRCMAGETCADSAQ